MKLKLGLLGVVFLAIGGATLSLDLTNIMLGVGYNLGRDTAMIQSAILGFVGFLLFGLGLWVIVLSGKTDTKQTPS